MSMYNFIITQHIFSVLHFGPFLNKLRYIFCSDLEYYFLIPCKLLMSLICNFLSITYFNENWILIVSSSHKHVIIRKWSKIISVLLKYNFFLPLYSKQFYFIYIFIFCQINIYMSKCCRKVFYKQRKWVP